MSGKKSWKLTFNKAKEVLPKGGLFFDVFLIAC